MLIAISNHHLVQTQMLPLWLEVSFGPDSHVPAMLILGSSLAEVVAMRAVSATSGREQLPGGGHRHRAAGLVPAEWVARVVQGHTGVLAAGPCQLQSCQSTANLSCATGLAPELVAGQIDAVQQGTGDNHAISALKFKIILEFLEAGWNVLLSDVDIVVVQVSAAICFDGLNVTCCLAHSSSVAYSELRAPCRIHSQDSCCGAIMTWRA